MAGRKAWAQSNNTYKSTEAGKAVVYLVTVKY